MRDNQGLRTGKKNSARNFVGPFTRRKSGVAATFSTRFASLR